MGIAGKRQMHRREAASWHHMTLQYSLTDAWCSDSFKKMSKKAFTFDKRETRSQLRDLQNKQIYGIPRPQLQGGESSPQS
jgi:hypothetical protein